MAHAKTAQSSVNDIKRFIPNKRTTNVMLRLASWFVVFKGTLLTDVNVVLKIVLADREARRRGAPYPRMALLFRALFCITWRKVEDFFGTIRAPYEIAVEQVTVSEYNNFNA
jgi:hypothetical protein